MSKPNIKIAIADDFLSSFASIPKQKQSKVLTFINKFRNNPTSASINYEKINNVKDDNLRSVRIDQGYRGIVLKPETGNVFLLLWVDNHDDAYQWAKNRVCKVNPATGSLQIFNTEITEGLSNKVSTKIPQFSTGLFAAIKDKYLLQFGVPELLLPLVRTINTEHELDTVEAELPQEAAEALFMLASGFSLDDVFNETNKCKVSHDVDTDDFETALGNPDSQRRFFFADDDLELAKILNAPLEKWRVFLHPTQRKLVEMNANGPVRVLGGAGTGKTVVAMHRAKWLAQKVFANKNDRILFTTYTRNLAADIKNNLRKICDEDVFKKIEVINLDLWVTNFLKKQGYDLEIDYGHQSSELWESALADAPTELGHPNSFYRAEWEQIIQAHGITSLNEYIKVARLGRGVRLNRLQRKLIWPVFEEYRLLLDKNKIREREDAMRDARQLLQNSGDILPYKSIIVDEAQDMGGEDFKLIRQIMPGGDASNDIFIVGDAHQRIYNNKVVLSKCGINIRGRGKKLYLNYRTTEENRRWATDVLEGISFDDLDGESDTQKGYKSLLHGTKPIIKECSSFDDEISFIVEYLNKVQSDGSILNEVCLVTRTKNMIDQYESSLNNKNIITQRIRRNKSDVPSKPGLRLATMHRVKGLEFNNVIIAGLTKENMPKDSVLARAEDPVSHRTAETREKSLLYVSATRAKKEVVITSFGPMSLYVK